MQYNNISLESIHGLNKYDTSLHESYHKSAVKAFTSLINISPDTFNIIVSKECAQRKNTSTKLFSIMLYNKSKEYSYDKLKKSEYLLILNTTINTNIYK